MLSAQSDPASFSGATTRGRRISKAAVFIAGTIIVLAFSYRWILQPSGQDLPNLTVNDSELQTKPLDKKNQDEAMRPFLELNKITPFGRSLELIGRAEAGSKVLVNDEAVEVSGDGYFKHFTKLFPASSKRVQLILKATDLAGRTRTLTAYHDFSAGQ
jgi:hypothetical protein